ncbi:5-hydroxytryptamine receptor 3A-like [Gadus morhua]|uniref:5-hydroxytryptamine receptor 3A-like n=1 Tax=Gadus morhua TaxID=8049 RepID=A0A8C4ZI40_GADMO|nr:5-hydroxytryptamine receptor 3A-like [Gadus morhua]
MRGGGVSTLFLLILLSTVCARASAACTTRRCLAQALIDRKLLSQPQTDQCKQTLKVPFIEYQTLSVDTKNLRFTSRMQARMEWTDPELAWNRSEYDYESVVLPVDKVWTPELTVTNSMSLVLLHGSKDLLASSDGTLKHTMSFIVVVTCEVNLFRYPFSSDMCPVAIEAWSKDGCGMDLKLKDVHLLDGEQGDWSTDWVWVQKRGAGQHFLMVSLSTKPMNPFISLILPSILILFVDVVSFALPLGGGERNSFKVTLALSFIMFLLILNSLLPGDSQCSPILRIHFCVCLVFLVLSMTASMLLTRVAKDGLMIPLLCCKKTPSAPSEPGEDPDEEASARGEGEKKDPGNELPEFSGDRLQLQKVVDFLEGVEEEKQQNERFYRIACRLDKICFYLYMLMCVVYFCLLTYMFTSYPCEINHFSFWY